MKFDDETGQFTVSKNGKVVAQSMAKTEARETKASEFQMRSSGTGDNLQLLGVTFGGQDKNVIISNNGAQSSGNN